MAVIFLGIYRTVEFLLVLFGFFLILYILQNL